MRLILNVIWLVFAGFWTALGYALAALIMFILIVVMHLITGTLLCLTIIGIPLGLANFKLIPVTLTPFGRDIVSIEEAQRLGLEQQLAMPGGPPRGV